jgi:hypothetical protein
LRNRGVAIRCQQQMSQQSENVLFYKAEMSYRSELIF